MHRFTFRLETGPHQIWVRAICSCQDFKLYFPSTRLEQPIEGMRNHLLRSRIDVPASELEGLIQQALTAAANDARPENLHGLKDWYDTI